MMGRQVALRLRWAWRLKDGKDALRMMRIFADLLCGLQSTKQHVVGPLQALSETDGSGLGWDVGFRTEDQSKSEYVYIMLHFMIWTNSLLLRSQSGN